MHAFLKELYRIVSVNEKRKVWISYKKHPCGVFFVIAKLLYC